MFFVWIKFIVSALVVVIAGVRLTWSAQLISRRVGLGVIWGGFLLLPLVTSLPELVTAWRAAVINSPDLAAGNIFGSILFNLAIIALIDLLQGKDALLARVKINHILPASFGLLVVGFTGLAILFPYDLRVYWLGLDTVLIFFLYITGTLLISYNEKKSERKEALNHNIKPEETDHSSKESLVPSLASFLLAGILIIIACINLTDSAEVIAGETGLGLIFVGTLLLAVSTSLPEIVTTLSAVRLGLPDMAVANIFGANLMNLAILFFTDAFYTRGPVLSVLSEGHLITVFFIVMITAVTIFGMVFRTSRVFAGVGYDSIVILIIYVLSFLSLYFLHI